MKLMIKVKKSYRENQSLRLSNLKIAAGLMQHVPLVKLQVLC